MTDTKIYEGMFLIDNQLVRAGWEQAKSVVTDTLAKHGGKIVTARRWDERKLAYPIDHKRRATYLLSYFELEPDNIPALRRDFELDERVLRYLQLAREEVPAEELEKAKVEEAPDFSVPPPPEDDEPEEEPEPEPEPRGRDRDRDRRGPRTEPKKDDAKPADGEAEAEKAEAKPADGEVKAEKADAKPADGEAKAEKAEAEPAEGEKAEAAPADTEKKEG